MQGCQEERTIFFLNFYIYESVYFRELHTHTNKQARTAVNLGITDRDKVPAKQLLKCLFNQSLWVNSCEFVLFSVVQLMSFGKAQGCELGAKPGICWDVCEALPQ